eukprot:2338957-Amphidinium_carterae.1
MRRVRVVNLGETQADALVQTKKRGDVPLGAAQQGVFLNASSLLEHLSIFMTLGQKLYLHPRPKVPKQPKMRYNVQRKLTLMLACFAQTLGKKLDVDAASVPSIFCNSLGSAV